MAWYSGNSENNIHPVGLKKCNELGLYDMSGNVWEWTEDSYSEKRRKDFNDYVTKGGSYRDMTKYCNPSNKFDWGWSYPSKDFGFRIILEVQ